ncbi:hypothetical protein M0P48_00180 [Candidatus Gracilibacteria bacterium]|nr:hypothetical protein [Candidatus Gracilibacteria bacterium]
MKKPIKIVIVSLSVIFLCYFLWQLFLVISVEKIETLKKEPVEMFPFMQGEVVPVPITADGTDEVLTIIKETIRTRDVTKVTEMFGSNFSSKENPPEWPKAIEKLDYFPFSRIVITLEDDDKNIFSEMLLDIQDNVRVDRDIVVKSIITDDSQVEEMPPNPDDFYNRNESIEIDETTNVLLTTEIDSNRIVDIIIR